SSNPASRVDQTFRKKFGRCRRPAGFNLCSRVRVFRRGTAGDSADALSAEAREMLQPSLWPAVFSIFPRRTEGFRHVTSLLETMVFAAVRSRSADDKACLRAAHPGFRNAQ